MNTFSINPCPAMTRYLVENGIFRSDPLIIVDLGARGGANEEWEIFGDQIRLFCFEPEETECQRLAAQAPAHITYIPLAIAKASGRATLYEAKLAASTGLYRTNMDYFGRLLNRDNGVTVAEHDVEVHTLDEVLARYGNPAVNFVKLDVEGAELDVLEGSPACLKLPSLVGILSEIRFHSEINGSPAYSALDAFLIRFGFRVYDLQFYHQSRVALPYPGLYDYRLPNGERFHAYTTHGQIQDGDALYFRDLLLPDNRDVAHSMSATDILKLCAMLEIYSFNDCAAELIQVFRATLEAQVECSRLLNFLASGIAGAEIGYDEYRQNYFSGKAPAVKDVTAAEPVQRKPISPASRLLWQSIARFLRKGLAFADRKLASY